MITQQSIFQGDRLRRMTRIGAGSAALTLLVIGLTNAVAPPAGTVIGNQASATYSDESNTVRTVTSEMVTTVVQQVASLTLTAPGAKYASPGGHVAFPHTITNTGNGTDSFALSTTGNTGGFTLSSLAFYADANGDGVADNTTPITTTGNLAANATFSFVVSATVPSNAASAATNTLTTTATSTFTGTVTAANADVTTSSPNAVVDVVKAIDLSTGPSSGTRTYTLSYTNTGNATATNLIITDVIPGGMTYVTGSGLWSGTGAVALTDATGDNQSGISYDFNITTANRVTAVIASVPKGASGILSFKVTVKAGLAPGISSVVGTSTINTALFSYTDGGTPTPTTTSPTSTNSVSYSVNQSVTLTYTGQTIASSGQGGTVSFTNPLTNTGSGSDVFDISVGTTSFPAGTTFTLYQSDGVTPLVDTNADGIPDTGPVAAAGVYNVVVKATLPAGASGGPFSVQTTATSTTTTGVTATATDTLTSISSNTVDLTDNAAPPTGLGIGAGPGATALVTNTTAPGTTTRFTMFVTNALTSTSDSFALQASTNSSFATQVLPTGWTVVFRDSNGAVITNTGTLTANTSKQIFADVTVPAGTAPATTNLYFRAISPSSGASDSIFNAVTVSTTRSLTFTPNHTGQIVPGGAIVYTHVVTNTGNVVEGNGTTSVGTFATTNAATGFSSITYWDKNNNGTLDSTDPVVTTLADLSAGTGGASTAAGLDPAESATVFVKVFAPANAEVGVTNQTPTTLTVTGVIGGLAAPSAVIAADASSVIAARLSLAKVQALDANCDGAAEGSFVSTTLTTGAVPGACIRYQITATNLGTADVTNVVISDATPANTIYVTVNPAAATNGGSVTAPANNAAGTVQATIATLSPNQSSVLTFGVRIQP